MASFEAIFYFLHKKRAASLRNLIFYFETAPSFMIYSVFVEATCAT